MRLLASALAMALVTAGCTSTPQPSACASPPVETGLDTGYRLGPGDRLRITVFRHPDLSGEFALDGEGVLALPLIGDIAAGGATPRQLEDEIETRFRRDEYLVTPAINIEVLTYRPFYILGEVARPGQYEYTNGMTVINAVALAGGYTYRANAGRISIQRGDCVTAAAAESAVLPGEIVAVPERFF